MGHNRRKKIKAKTILGTILLNTKANFIHTFSIITLNFSEKTPIKPTKKEIHNAQLYFPNRYMNRNPTEMVKTVFIGLIFNLSPYY